MGHLYHNYNTEQYYPVLSFQFELNSFSPLVVCLYQCFFFKGTEALLSSLFCKSKKISCIKLIMLSQL